MFQTIKENVWYILNNIHACKKYVYHIKNYIPCIIFNIFIYHASLKKFKNVYLKIFNMYVQIFYIYMKLFNAFENNIH